MRRSNWTPSIVPREDDQNVYLVLDDLGRHGRSWREADAEATDLETVITGPSGRPVQRPGPGGGFQHVGKMVAGCVGRRRGGARRPDGIFISEFEQGEIGPDLFRKACEFGLEGLVSKRRDSVYRPGRSPNWIKVKNRKHPAMTRVRDALA